MSGNAFVRPVCSLHMAVGSGKLLERMGFSKA